MPIAFNPVFELREIDLTDDTSVPATTGTNDQSLTPDVGKVWQVVQIYFSAPDPAGSSSGTHGLRFYPRSEVATNNLIAYVQGNFGSAINIGQNMAFNGDAKQPATQQYQVDLMYKGILWSNNTKPFLFRYYNTTDVAQAGTRTLKFLVREFNEP